MKLYIFKSEARPGQWAIVIRCGYTELDHRQGKRHKWLIYKNSFGEALEQTLATMRCYGMPGDFKPGRAAL